MKVINHRNKPSPHFKFRLLGTKQALLGQLLLFTFKATEWRYRQKIYMV